MMMVMVLSANDTPSDWQTDTITLTQGQQTAEPSECYKINYHMLLLLVYFSHNFKHWQQ